MYDAILVATDGGADAQAATTEAISLAASLECPLHGIAVVETRTAYDSGIVDPEEVRERLTADAQSALSTLEEAGLAEGVSPVTSLRTGVPHEEIVAYATTHDIDLLVLGSSGRSSFKRALLGSTVTQVVRETDRSVLVVGAGTN